MTTGRVSSLALVTDVLRDVGSSQVKLAELQSQISSGYKSENFAGLDGSVEQFTQVSAQINRTTQFNANNQLNISKLQAADIAVKKIIDIADRIKNNIVGGNSATLHTANLPQIIEDLLTSMGSELNSSFNGYYLFGGTDTTNPPVPDTKVNNDVPGVPDTNFYVGSAADSTMRVDDRTDVAFPVRADDQAFQKIYAAARQAILAAKNGDTIELQRAQQLIQDGQKDLVSARSRVGSTLLSVQAIDERLKSVTTYWKELTDNVSKTDIVAASTQVAGYTAVLQASFQVYSRLSQLRLSDYLN
jgi:flagellar hook-associated protein 3 FlgL